MLCLLNYGMTEVDSCNAEFLEDEFPSVNEIKKNPKLYESQQDNPLSPGEGEIYKLTMSLRLVCF